MNKEKSVVSFNRLPVQKNRGLEVGGEHAYLLHCLIVYEILTDNNYIRGTTSSKDSYCFSPPKSRHIYPYEFYVLN